MTTGSPIAMNSDGSSSGHRSRDEFKRRRLEFTERAAGTLQYGYDEAKMIDAV
jgi:hypothetical protein